MKRSQTMPRRPRFVTFTKHSHGKAHRIEWLSTGGTHRNYPRSQWAEEPDGPKRLKGPKWPTDPKVTKGPKAQRAQVPKGPKRPKGPRGPLGPKVLANATRCYPVLPDATWCYPVLPCASQSHLLAQGGTVQVAGARRARPYPVYESGSPNIYGHPMAPK